MVPIGKKLRYFEDEKKLERMKEAGFNGAHLASIVGVQDGKKLRYFEDEKERMKEAGFEGAHLADIVYGSDWEES